MPQRPSGYPYDRPLGRPALVALTAFAAALAALMTLALTADHWVPRRKAFKEALAAIVAPYQVLYDASLPGDTANEEYVIFLQDGADRAQVQRFLAARHIQRVNRIGIFPGTVVVKISRAHPGDLNWLRAQPFVRLTVRNSGLFFCH